MNKSLKSNVYCTNLDGNWKNAVKRVLDNSNLNEKLSNDTKNSVLLKPNLVEASPPPITTSLELVKNTFFWIRENFPDKKVIIGEGCGSISYETDYVFEKLGFAKFAKENNIELIDLNYAKTIVKKIDSCTRWTEMHLPEIIYNSFLISMPVLKGHSMADVTLSMKNMLGCAPPKFYCSGSWKKSAFHNNLQEAIFELNLYRKADFIIMDASVGMSQAHLWGPTCNPPVNKIIASDDTVAIDAFATELLGKDWKKIKHIKMADKILGNAESKNIILV